MQAAVAPLPLKLDNPLYAAYDMGCMTPSALQSMAFLGGPPMQPPSQPLPPSPLHTSVTVNELFATTDDTLPSKGIACDLPADNKASSWNSINSETQLPKHDAHKLSSIWASASSDSTGSFSSRSLRSQLSLHLDSDRSFSQEPTTSSSCPSSSSARSSIDAPTIPAQKLVPSCISRVPNAIPSSGSDPMSSNPVAQLHLAKPVSSAEDALTISKRGSLQSVTTLQTSPWRTKKAIQKLSLPPLQMRSAKASEQDMTPRLETSMTRSLLQVRRLHAV